MYVIGCVSFTVCSLVEIFDRLNACFTIFSIIVNGVLAYYVICDYKNNEKLVPQWGRCIVCLALFANIWPILSLIPNRFKDEYMLFLWDSNGKGCIPSNIYPMSGK